MRKIVSRSNQATLLAGSIIFILAIILALILVLIVGSVRNYQDSQQCIRTSVDKCVDTNIPIYDSDNRRIISDTDFNDIKSIFYSAFVIGTLSVLSSIYIIFISLSKKLVNNIGLRYPIYIAINEMLFSGIFLISSWIIYNARRFPSEGVCTFFGLATHVFAWFQCMLVTVLSVYVYRIVLYNHTIDLGIHDWKLLSFCFGIVIITSNLAVSFNVFGPVKYWCQYSNHGNGKIALIIAASACVFVFGVISFCYLAAIFELQSVEKNLMEIASKSSLNKPFKQRISAIRDYYNNVRKKSWTDCNGIETVYFTENESTAHLQINNRNRSLSAPLVCPSHSNSDSNLVDHNRRFSTINTPKEMSNFMSSVSTDPEHGPHIEDPCTCAKKGVQRESSLSSLSVRSSSSTFKRFSESMAHIFESNFSPRNRSATTRTIQKMLLYIIVFLIQWSGVGVLFVLLIWFQDENQIPFQYWGFCVTMVHTGGTLNALVYWYNESWRWRASIKSNDHNFSQSSNSTKITFPQNVYIPESSSTNAFNWSKSPFVQDIPLQNITAERKSSKEITEEYIVVPLVRHLSIISEESHSDNSIDNT